MEVKKHFFSRENLDMLTDVLGERLERDDKDSLVACRELLKSQMKLIYTKNGNILNKAPMQKVLKHLNEKSLDLCEKIYHDKIHNGKRVQRTQQKMQRQSMTHKNTVGDYDISNTNGSYAPIQLGGGEFMAADGSMGTKFQMGQQQDSFTSKAEIKGELERKLAERLGQYETQGIMQNQGQQGQQYNPYMQNQKPPEIDFSLDGSGKKTRENTVNNDVDFEAFNNFENLSEYNPNMNMNMGHFDANQNQNQNQNTDMTAMMSMMQQMFQTIINNQNQQKIPQVDQEYNNMLSLNTDLKKTVASQLGINPQAMLNMSSDEIGKLLNTKPTISKVQEPETMDIVKQLLQIKKTNAKKLAQMQQSSSSSEEEVVVKHKNKPQIKIKQNAKKKTKSITIDCSNMVKQICDYNDYMVEFSEVIGSNLCNVSNINLTDISISYSAKINNKCNSFDFLCDGEKTGFEFDDGEYEINEIVEAFNENFETLACGLVMKVKNDHVVMSHKRNETFEILCLDNTINKYLGFTQDNYSGESKYTSECIHAFISSDIYMYIKNISESPFAIIKSDGSYKQQNVKLVASVPTLSCIIIQFRIGKSIDSNLANLCSNTHTITLDFEISE